MRAQSLSSPAAQMYMQSEEDGAAGTPSAANGASQEARHFQGAHIVFGDTERMKSESSASSLSRSFTTSRLMSQSLEDNAARHHYVATSVSSSTGEDSESWSQSQQLRKIAAATGNASRPFPRAASRSASAPKIVGLASARELHDRGECTPCAAFMRGAGCDDGDNCPNCHFCRKKPKHRLGKNQRMRYIQMADCIVEQMKDSPGGPPVFDTCHPFLYGILRKRGVDLQARDAVSEKPGRSAAGQSTKCSL